MVSNRKQLSDRFSQALNHIYVSFPNDNKTQIAKHCGTQLNVLRDIVNGVRKITYDQLGKFIKHYHLNKQFFYAEENFGIPLFITPPPKIEEVIQEPTLKQAIGARYKEIRNFLGMTQSEIATEIGVTQSHWAYIESSKITASDTIKSILHIRFGVSYEYMIQGDGPINLQSPDNPTPEDVPYGLSDVLKTVFARGPQDGPSKRNSEHKNVQVMYQKFELISR